MSSADSSGSLGPALHASAPGRVNLMGEHTDYNEGWVLPMPIPQETRVALSLRDDLVVKVWSARHAATEEYRLGHEARRGSWVDYVQGVTYALEKAGHTISGFEAHVSSTVPMGAGLASSAALEVALLRALRAAFSLALDDQTIALLGHDAEVSFVGVPVGVMDQMACSVGQPGGALLLDTRTLARRLVAVPPALELVVIASGITHAHEAGDYRLRRAECEQAARQLGVRSLRDVTLEALAPSAGLTDTLQRRVRHIVTENARVHETVTALEALDRPRLRALFAASHASMRDDYAVSIPQIDRLVALAEETPGVVGARLTGGGFGGSVVMLAERGRARAAADAIAEAYAQRTGCAPSILLPRGDSHDQH